MAILNFCKSDLKILDFLKKVDFRFADHPCALHCFFRFSDSRNLVAFSFVSHVKKIKMSFGLSKMQKSCPPLSLLSSVDPCSSKTGFHLEKSSTLCFITTYAISIPPFSHECYYKKILLHKVCTSTIGTK